MKDYDQPLGIIRISFQKLEVNIQNIFGGPVRSDEHDSNNCRGTEDKG